MLRNASPYAERFVTGKKSALLAFAVPADRYRANPDAPWQPRDRGFEHGRGVYSVSHSRLTTSSQGGECSIRALPSQQRIDLLITEIRMVDVARLSDAEIRALGLSADEFAVLYGHQVASLRGWLIYAIPVPARNTPH